MAAAAASIGRRWGRAIDALTSHPSPRPSNSQSPGPITRLLAIGLLVLAVLVLTAPLLPSLHLTPNRDSGVYLYAAQRMLAGDALYRDVWDHKPPLVYVPSLAAALTGVPLWGLWGLAVSSLGGAFGLLAAELRSRWGWAAAACGVAAAVVLLGASFKGNLPEEYGLALQVLALVGYARLATDGTARPGRTAALVGGLGAMAALLKPTLIGLWLAMALLALVPRDWDSIRRRTQVLWAAVGGAVVLFCTGAVLLAGGVWQDFWSDVIEYNVAYAAGGDRWARLSESLARLGPPGLLALAGVALLYLLAVLAWQRRASRPAGPPWTAGGAALAALALMDLPIEALLAAGTGRLYLQYLTPWIPAIAILAAVVTGTWVAPRLRVGVGRWALAALLTGLVAAWALTTAKTTSRQAEAAHVWLAVERITGTTTAREPVLIWGAEAQVLALSVRAAPSRYAYLYPLITVGYADAESVGRFADDLRVNPPALIIDTSATNPVIPPLDAAVRAAWVSSDSQYAVPPELEPVMAWIQADYRRVEPIGAWDAYVRVSR